MRSFLRERPWIWIWVAFVALIGAWGALFALAVKYQPEPVPAAAVSPRNPPSP